MCSRINETLQDLWWRNRWMILCDLEKGCGCVCTSCRRMWYIWLKRPFASESPDVNDVWPKQKQSPGCKENGSVQSDCSRFAIHWGQLTRALHHAYDKSKTSGASQHMSLSRNLITAAKRISPISIQSHGHKNSRNKKGSPTTVWGRNERVYWLEDGCIKKFILSRTSFIERFTMQTWWLYQEIDSKKC